MPRHGASLRAPLAPFFGKANRVHPPASTTFHFRQSLARAPRGPWLARSPINPIVFRKLSSRRVRRAYTHAQATKPRAYMSVLLELRSKHPMRTHMCFVAETRGRADPSPPHLTQPDPPLPASLRAARLSQRSSTRLRVHGSDTADQHTWRGASFTLCRRRCGGGSGAAGGGRGGELDA